MHRLLQPGTQRRVGHVPQVAELVADRVVGEGQPFAVERLVEGGLGLLLGHRAAALQPDAGEEHLLVQADAAPADQHHPGDGGDE